MTVDGWRGVYTCEGNHLSAHVGRRQRGEAMFGYVCVLVYLNLNLTGNVFICMCLWWGNIVPLHNVRLWHSFSTCHREQRPSSQALTRVNLLDWRDSSPVSDTCGWTACRIVPDHLQVLCFRPLLRRALLAFKQTDVLWNLLKHKSASKSIK